MKTQLIALMAGALLIPASATFAGQDYPLQMQIQRTAKAKQQAAQEQAARQQTQEGASVAGAKGEEGKVAPRGGTYPKAGCMFRNPRSDTCAKYPAPIER